MWMRFFTVLLALCLAMPALAEEPTQAPKGDTQLEEIVVTATRTPEEISKAPGSVSVVTNKDIEQRNIESVDQAVNTLSGVYDSHGKGLMDTQTAITLGGIPDQKRTLIMVDGMTMNTAFYGNVNYIGLSPDNVERIEVVQGPFSSLYGGYAMGGVVNIITRMPEKQEFIFKEGYGSSFQDNKGLDNLHTTYASFGDRFQNKLSVFLSYNHQSTEGYPSNLNVQSSAPTDGITGWKNTTDPFGNHNYLIGDKGDNGCSDDNLTFKAAYDFSPDTKVDAMIMRTYYKYTYGDPHTYLKDAVGNPVFTYGTGYEQVMENSYLDGPGGEESFLYHVGGETVLGTAKIKLSLGVNDETSNWYISPGYTADTTTLGGPGDYSNTPSRDYMADLQVTQPVLSRQLLTFGASYKHGTCENTDYELSDWKNQDTKTAINYMYGGKDESYALFAQDEIMIMDKLTTYIGLRGDWWRTYDGEANQVGSAGYPQDYSSRTDTAYSPKLALVYKPLELTTLRFDAGKAFRPPDVYELYSTWTGWGMTYSGNPHLKPETTSSWDIGVKQGLWKGATCGVTYFENYLEDLIYPEYVSSTQVDYINAAKAQSKGVKLDADQRISDWLRLYANCTFDYATIKKNDYDPASDGKRLVDLPARMANLGVELTQGPVAGTLTCRDVSRRYGDDDVYNNANVKGVLGSFDPYYTIDTKLSYQITKWGTLSFAVDNILNKERFDYYLCPGRSWNSELTLKF